MAQANLFYHEGTLLCMPWSTAHLKHIQKPFWFRFCWYVKILYFRGFWRFVKILGMWISRERETGAGGRGTLLKWHLFWFVFRHFLNTWKELMKLKNYRFLLHKVVIFHNFVSPSLPGPSSNFVSAQYLENHLSLSLHISHGDWSL